MEPLIAKCLEVGLSIRLEQINKDEIAYAIPGFYKSGEIKLIKNSGLMYQNTEDNSQIAPWTAIARYDEKTEIWDFDDLISLNFDWWERSKGRSEAWANPEEPWAKLMLEKGWVETETKIIYKIKSNKWLNHG